MFLQQDLKDMLNDLSKRNFKRNNTKKLNLYENSSFDIWVGRQPFLS